MDANLKFTDEQGETSFADTVSGDTVLTIPLFQRPYRWTKQNLDWLMADIKEITRDQTTQSEFMGVIVAVHRSVKPGRPIPFEVVDGQQRLTTLYLFVLAASEVLARAGEQTDAANLVGSYLLVRRMADNPVNTKLVPSIADRGQFKAIWDGVMSVPGFSAHPDIEANPPKPPAAVGEPTGRMKGQYNRIRTNLKAVLEENSKEELLEIVAKVVGNLSVVNITLKDPTVAPKIFERLNARAEPITIADLVRNEVFVRTTSDDPDEAQTIFRDYWEPFIGRFANADGSNILDKFLFPYGLIYKSSITKRDLFTSLRERWASLDGPKEIINDMERYADAFLALETHSDDITLSDELKVMLHRLNRLGKPSSIYAFVMRLVREVREQGFDEDAAIAVLSAVEDFLFRRAVCGIEPTGLHAVFKGMWGEIIEQHGAVTMENVVDFISSKPTISWPSDEEFSAAVVAGNLYNRRVAKYAIAEFELSRFGETPQDDFQIEHVLPQTLSDPWQEIFGPKAPELLNTWANLVPLTETMNPKLSNSIYATKRPHFEGSMFATTREFAERYEEWTPALLEERALEISDWAKERWPTCPA